MTAKQRELKKQTSYGANYASDRSTWQQDKMLFLLPPRLGLIRVILLFLINRVTRRFMKGKFSSLTISLSDKSIVSNWSCYQKKGTKTVINTAREGPGATTNNSK